MSTVDYSPEKYTKEAHDIPAQKLTVPCECGRTHCATFVHYQVRKFGCGCFYWALRPTWDKTLELRVFQGNMLAQPGTRTTF